jgi:acetyl/propionyl-CoA carboxylase alpha subunit
MGSKIEARALMQAAGVPVVPGETPKDQSDDELRRAVDRVGLPALVKAAAGGGGKGMRLVRAVDEVVDAVQAARREAIAAFGDGTLYVERLIERPRHIEVQIFGDAHGHVVHLFERDCSVQRRHQKVIEEARRRHSRPPCARA